MTLSVSELLTSGRLQEAEWLIRRGASTPLTTSQLADRLNTQLSPDLFYVSPGYYAPLPNWSDANTYCGDAYQAISVVERYRRQQELAVSSHLCPYGIRQLAAIQHVWLSLDQPSSLRVLDLGGALGSHFHTLEPLWPWCSLNWTVCETSTVASVGRDHYEIDRSNGTTLRFTDQLFDCIHQGIDLVFASCSLQYIEHWQTMLSDFQSVPWLLLDRVPLVDHPSDLIAIQVVPSSYTDTRYPGWKFSESTWLPRLSKLGFNSVMHWLVPEDRWNIFDLRTGSYRWSATHDHGFLFHNSHSVLTDFPVTSF